ncbi:MAG TPA: AAC(3)-I family aminoglycoside N-acetyltransferase [Allosphingosinicella sp.]|jgi:aminoglycoside 3-N-acetyltransferase I
MEGRFNLCRLGADDVDLARRVNELFGKAFDEPETYEGDPPSEAYLAELLGKAHVIALAALSDGEVVGGLVAYELDKLERARREVYIYDLAVAQGHRRRGIATALIERCREIAAERGAWVIFVQADYEDAPAVALYEKMGRREEVLHFDIPVEGPRR